MENTNPADLAFAALFGNNPDVSLDERARVLAELQKIGSLTFEVSKDEDGWMAVCKEVPGIMTGSTNPNPSQSEIEAEIRSAIFSAFNVKEEPPKAMKTPYSFSYRVAVPA